MSWRGVQALYGAYQKWCEATGERPMTQTAMGKRLTERGFEQARTRDARRWRGIGLRNFLRDVWALFC